MQPRRTSKIISGFILKLAALLLLNASFHQATGAGGDLTITGKVSDAAACSAQAATRIAANAQLRTPMERLLFIV